MEVKRTAPTPGGPDVIVDFVFDDGLLFIALANIGLAPATAVSVLFNRPIRGLGGRKVVSETALFRRTEFLLPGKRIQTFLDTSAAYFRRGEPLEIETEVNFADRTGNLYVSRIRHNLDIYREIGYIQRQG